ncbi:DNA-binding response regulator [Streptomyces sp. S1D4-11]|nr:DNA-binding response regulator [Streptomyces sp. S1D4-11]QIY93333.1 DNA-binding response regulator [Streptomyces sp. S1D4-11]
MPAKTTITVHGEQELAARAGHLFAEPKSEFVCAATDLNTWSHRAARDAAVGQMGTRITGGLTVRKLYSAAVLADEDQRLHLLELRTVGAQVRICATGLPHETIISDRKAMILAGAKVRGERDFTATTSSTLIDAVCAMFDAAWEGAVDLEDYLSQDLPVIDEDGRALLRMLTTGLTDEAAARRMGLSLRTYRRRVAEMMRLLEAESRFQAGVRAGELGIAG